MIHLHARRYREQSAQHRNIIALDVLRSVQENGRFIKLRRNGWQVIADETAIKKIKNTMRYINRRKNTGSDEYLTDEITFASTTVRKSGQRKMAQIASPNKAQVLAVSDSEAGATLPWNEPLKVNSMSLIYELVLNAQQVIQTAQSEALDSNIDTVLSECPNTLCDQQNRKKYMEYLCSRHFDTDVENNRKLDHQHIYENTGFAEGVAFETTDGSGPTLNQAPTLKINEQAVDTWLSDFILSHKRVHDADSEQLPTIGSEINVTNVDYLTMPIDVDESILIFLNATDCASSTCPSRSSDEVSEEDVLYEQKLSAFINLAEMKIGAVNYTIGDFTNM